MSSKDISCLCPRAVRAYNGLSHFKQYFCQWLLSLSHWEAVTTPPRVPPCPQTPYQSTQATGELRRLRPYTGRFTRQPLCHSGGTTENRSSFSEWWWFFQPSPGLLLVNNHMGTWKQALNHSRMRSAGPKSQSLRHHCQKLMVDHGWWRRNQSLSAILVWLFAVISCLHKGRDQKGKFHSHLKMRRLTWI